MSSLCSFDEIIELCLGGLITCIYCKLYFLIP